MAIPLIDNLTINSNLPIDSRIIASSSVERDAIKYKYDGLRVFQLDTRTTYTWNLSSYTASGITATSWDTIEPGVGNVSGYGSYSYVPVWDNTGSGLTNSSIISPSASIYEQNQKVGIGGYPMEAFQVNGNYSPSTIGGTSSPFVIHKGLSTVIGENWYYGITSGQDQNFYSYLGSSTITFNSGGFIFSGRTPGSSATMSALLNINSDSSVNFNNYLSTVPISTQPPITNGSMYFDYTSDRWKVMENGNSRFISETYKVYRTVLSQLGTSAPTEVLLDSTIGTGTWSYVSVGVYNLVISGGFSGSCPQINGFCGPYTASNVFFGQKVDNNTYQIETMGVTYTTTSNNCLNNTFIEIKLF